MLPQLHPGCRPGALLVSYTPWSRKTVLPRPLQVYKTRIRAGGIGKIGALGGLCSHDLRFKRPLLYCLSYQRKFSAKS